MSENQSAETRELSLVEKVEFRIALADSDTKLQNVLRTYLAPLLLKLASEHVSVRNKVISICQHVNNRVKPQNIQLPTVALLKQFKDNTGPLIRHFDLIYAQQGLGRLSTSEQADLVPILISGIASSAAASAIHGATIFNMLLRCLFHYNLPSRGSKEGEALQTTLGMNKDDASFLSFWIGKLLILRISLSKSTTSNLPGLSSDEISFLTLQGKEGVWDASSESGLNLTETKVKCLQLLSSSAFEEPDRFLPALFASSDPNSKISDSGEELLKRTLPNVDLKSSKLISQLFDLYFGSNSSASGNPETFVPAVRVPLRTKILNVLTRSDTSTTFPQSVVKLVAQDLLQDFQTFTDVSKTDREMAKLRSAIVSFLSFAGRTAAKSDLDAISRPVIKHLREFVEQEARDTQSLEVRGLRGQSFVIIGVLAAANRDVIVEPELELLRWLFLSLREEKSKEVLVSIDEALSTVLRSFQEKSTLEVQSRLEELLSLNMTAESPNSRNVRYASVRFANRCLPYHSVGARWIDLIALGKSSHESHETVEEAKNGLNPYWHETFHALQSFGSNLADESSVQFPNVNKLVEFIFWDQPSLLDEELSITAVEYCRQALFCESLASQGVNLVFDSQWDRKLDLAVTEEADARSAIRRHLEKMAQDHQNKPILTGLINAALSGLLSGQAKTEKRISASRILVELFTLLPESFLSQLSSKFSSLERGVLANDIGIRSSSAHAYGLLTSHPDSDSSAMQSSLDSLFAKIRDRKNASGVQINQVHGSLLALAIFSSRRLYRTPQNQLGHRVLVGLLPEVLNAPLESTDSLIQHGAFSALGQLSMFFVLSQSEIEKSVPVSKVIESIQKWAKNGNETAISALGYISMIFDEEKESDNLQSVIDKIYELHEIRQAETQFTVGEALTCAACGWRASNMPARLDIDGPIPQGPPREKSLEPLLDRILNDCGKTTKPSLKKASVIWLLSFVQFCGTEPAVQSRLRKFQAVFKRCLSDRDELVQESASRGLGLVYDKGNRELKDDLVRDLVNSFSSNRADISGSITEDTQLFEPGALPTGEGSSVSTYKDIMSLASEVGDSSLVYRFMSLASSDAIWSSRAAFGKFGLSNVLSDSNVNGYLASNPKLYPKLYRYRFDPNSKVRRSMNDIWNALVKDSAAVVEAQFDAIIEDLLSNILGKEWRTREACCAAIAELVQGRKLEKVAPYLDRIWDSGFKVLDDIKDSVRRAAADLCRSMSALLIRNLEAAEGSSTISGKMLQSVFPFLFSTSGLESKAKEVQAFALQTLQDVIKKSRGPTLRPFVPSLVENLLGLLTSLEHEAVNYVYLNASKYNISEQDIDEARLSQIRTSPMMDAVERCLDLLDEATMPELARHLQAAMRSAVGMPSKVGCSRVLVSLSTRRSFLFKPYADKFLEVLPKYLSDRNETVSSSYATALGYVTRGASNEAILKISALCKSMYFESEDDRRRITSGDIVYAIAKHSTDRFTALGAAFLPFVFLARHDDNEEVAKQFKNVWNENTGGPRAASLYMQEIAALAQDHVASNRWTLKHASALAIAELTEAVAAVRDKLNAEDSRLIWPVLKKALAEKSWDGKERVLKGLVVFAEKSRGSEADAAEIDKIAIREAKRRNRAYQSYALGCLGKIAACGDHRELADAVFGIVESILDEDAERDKVASKADADEEKMTQRVWTNAIDAIFAAIGLGQSEDAASKDLARASRGLELVAKVSVASHFHATIHSATLHSVNTLLEQLNSLPSTQTTSDAVLSDQFAAVIVGPRDTMVHAQEAVRLHRSDAFLRLATFCRLRNLAAPAQVLTVAPLDEKSPQARQKLQEALHIFQSLPNS